MWLFFVNKVMFTTRISSFKTSSISLINLPVRVWRVYVVAYMNDIYIYIYVSAMQKKIIVLLSKTLSPPPSIKRILVQHRMCWNAAKIIVLECSYKHFIENKIFYNNWVAPHVYLQWFRHEAVVQWRTDFCNAFSFSTRILLFLLQPDLKGS